MDEQVYPPQHSLLSEAMRQAAECYITKDSKSWRSRRRSKGGESSLGSCTSSDSLCADGQQGPSELENKKLWEQHYSQFLDHLVSMPMPTTPRTSASSTQDKSTSSGSTQEKTIESFSSTEPNFLLASVASNFSTLGNNMPMTSAIMTTDDIPKAESADRNLRCSFRSANSYSILDLCPTFHSIRQQPTSVTSKRPTCLQDSIAPENKQAFALDEILLATIYNERRNSVLHDDIGLPNFNTESPELKNVHDVTSITDETGIHKKRTHNKPSVRLVHSESMMNASDMSVQSSTRSIRSDPRSSSTEKRKQQSLFNKLLKSFGTRRSKKRNDMSKDDPLDTALWRGHKKNLIKRVDATNPASIDHSARSIMSEGSTESREKIMKAAFTEFHNSQHSGVDSVNPYLGDNSSVHKGRIFTMYGPIERTKTGRMRLSCSVPTENYIKRNREVTLLLPIAGTDNWSMENRYLIIPALFAQCPTSVLDFFWKKDSLQAPLDSPPLSVGDSEAFDNQRNNSQFCRQNLGMVAGISISQGMPIDSEGWLCRIFVLCQNYLLEYEQLDDINGPPRGYIHLQNALISAHPLFENAVELEFLEQNNLGSKKKVC